MVHPAMSHWERTAAAGVEVYHPNRQRPVIQGTRAAIVLLLFASIVLMLAITIGGWRALAGMQPVQIIYILVYLVLTVQALRWSRGSLAVSAALAIVLAVLALVSVSSWSNRDKSGFAAPALPESTLGLLCALLIPVQLLLIVFAMRGFRQGWNVEEERPLFRDRPPFTDPRARAV